MPHINPTLIAPTQPSGSACPTRAGSAPILGNLDQREAQLAEICQLKAYELPNLTPLQRVQLSEITRRTLDEEMSLLSQVVGLFKRAFESKEDAAVLKRLADIMDLLGLTASRTASVLRVESAVNGGSRDDPRTKDILEHLQDSLFKDDPQKEAD